MALLQMGSALNPISHPQPHIPQQPFQSPTYQISHLGTTTSAPRAPLFMLATTPPLTFQLPSPPEQTYKHLQTQSKRSLQEKLSLPASPTPKTRRSVRSTAGLRARRHGSPLPLGRPPRCSPAPALSVATSSAPPSRRGVADLDLPRRTCGAFHRYSNVEKGKGKEGCRAMEAPHIPLAGSRRRRTLEPRDFSASDTSGTCGGSRGSDAGDE